MSKGWLERQVAHKLSFSAPRIFDYTGKGIDLWGLDLYLALIGDWFLLFVGRLTQSLGQSVTDQRVFFIRLLCCRVNFPVTQSCVAEPPFLPCFDFACIAYLLSKPHVPKLFCWELTFQGRYFERHIQTVAAVTHLVFICFASSKNIVSRPIENSLERPLCILYSLFDKAMIRFATLYWGLTRYTWMFPRYQAIFNSRT